jgi:prevent-host-death family protein
LTEIGAFEARDKLSWLLDRVEQGEEIIITRYGRPVARLISTSATNAGSDPSQAQAALERMRDRAGQAGLGRFDWETLKADRHASSEKH